MYSEFLTWWGASVIQARDGPEGFAKACESLPDVIVIDVMLPGIDGLALAERLHATKATQAVPVIVLGQRIEPRIADGAQRNRGAAYLLKPCLPRALATVIRRLLELEPAG